MANTSRHLSWKEWFTLLAICWLAFALRVHRLDARSLWIDEGVSLYRSSQPLPELLRGEMLLDGGQVDDATPPVFYLWLAFVRALAGNSVFSLRMASVLAGFLGVPLLFVIGRRLFGRPAGLAAAFLGALSPYWVWTTQAALPDSLMLTLCLLSLLALHRLIKSRKGTFRNGVFWFLTTAVALYTHWAGIWMLCFELIVVGVLVVQNRRRWGLLSWAMILILVALPLMGDLSTGESSQPGYRPPWYAARQVVTEHTVENAPPSASRESDSPVSSLLPGLRLLPTILLTLGSLMWLLCYPRRMKSWMLVGGFLLVPPVFANLPALQSVSPLDLAYPIIVLPAFLLLQGAGAAALWRRVRPLATIALVGVLVVTSYWLSLQFNDPAFYKDDLKKAAEYVSRYAREGDLVVLQDALAKPVWDYYYDSLVPVEVIPHHGSDSQEAALIRFREASQEYRQLWFLHQPGPRGDLDPRILAFHANSYWFKFDQQDFSSIWLDVGLEAYMASPPIVTLLPSEVNGADLCWPGGLCLKGWSVENLVLGQDAEVTLYWAQEVATEDDFKVSLSLRDNQDQSWSQRGGLLFPYFPASRWPVGLILAETWRLPISPALPPTRFSLALTIQRVSDGEFLRADSGEILNSLGQVTAQRPNEPIDPRDLSLQYEHQVSFGGTVRLLGYNLPNDTPRPGHISFIDFFWESIAVAPEGWRQVTRLVDKEGLVWVEKVGSLTLGEFDLTQWKPGDLVWGRIFFLLPGQMPAGEYRVEISLINPDDEPIPAAEIWRTEAVESVVVGPAYLQNWPLLTNPPDMPHRPDVVLGGAIRLWGYNIEGIARSGEELVVTLVWRDEMPVGADYRVFVHLMNDQEQILGQSDGVPAGWTRPTVTWRAGEYVVDEHRILIPSGTPAGPVFLWTGLYDPNGSGRLSVTGAAEDQPCDRVLLDILVVEP